MFFLSIKKKENQPAEEDKMKIMGCLITSIKEERQRGRNLRPPVLVCPHTDRLQISLCRFFELAVVKVHWQVS